MGLALTSFPIVNNYLAFCCSVEYNLLDFGDTCIRAVEKFPYDQEVRLGIATCAF